MPISTDNMGPSMLPQGMNADGTPSLSQPITIDPPSSFGQGGTPKLASAFQGVITDTQAAMQETQRTMREMTMLANRLSTMVGGSGAPSGPVMSIEPNSPLSDAVSRAHTGLAYGTGLNLVVSASGYAGGIQMPGGGSTMLGMSSAAAGFASPVAMPVPDTSAVGVVPPGGVTSDAGPGTQGTNVQPNTPDTEPAELSDIAKNQKRLLALDAVQDGFASGYAGGHSMQGIARSVQNWAQGQNASELGQTMGKSKLLFGEEGDEAGGIVGKLASGSSVVDAVAAGIGGDSAVASLGVVGLVAGAADAVYHFGGNFLAGQRAEGATFQSMEGGTNLQGQAARGHQMGFEGSTFGTFTSAQADQIFQGTMATGLRGGGLTRGLNFVTQNYQNLGMSPEESIAFLQESVAAGVTSFQTLGDALQDVSSTAQAAGVNAETTRQSFASMYNQLLGQGAGEGTAATVAAAETGIVTKMGLVGEGTTSLATGSVQLQAAALGMSVGDYVSQTLGNSPAAIALRSKGLQAAQTRLLGPLSITAAGATKTYEEELKAGGGKLSQSELTSGKGLQEFFQETNLTPQQLVQRLEAGGWTSTSKDKTAAAEAYIGQYLSGGANIAKAGKTAANNIEEQKKQAAWIKAEQPYMAKDERIIEEHSGITGNAFSDQSKDFYNGVSTVAKPPAHPSDTAKKDTTKTTSTSDGKNVPRSSSSSSGTTNVKVTIGFADGQTSKLLKATAEQTSTYALQGMGNPTSPIKVKG